ncbi:Cytosolic phospholipase A2 delta [Colletotrichum chlorophyti]|uniref:Lysophospholipase n=1 Tax=Colletotrichum chlorophyti TaxID=708187 RepID=A0A1Q8S2T2_9PEZI|nr:Cytosolic phospholipase A2 delta [Colletotrichum chlorophyti]
MRLFAAYSRDSMRRGGRSIHSVTVGRIRTHGLLIHRRPTLSRQSQHSFFTAREKTQTKKRSSVPLAIITAGLVTWLLYPSEDFSRLSLAEADRRKALRSPEEENGSNGSNETAWYNFALKFETLSNATDVEWSADKIVGFILPEWSRLIPGYLRKLQREVSNRSLAIAGRSAHTNQLSMAPGSLADEIWREAHDPFINPEVRYAAKVRVSDDLCEEEKEFLSRRKKVTTMALAKYLELDEKDIHPEDVPVIAMCGSGGGLRALVAGTGSMLAADEDGLFDCITYTSGVSGSCWLQALYHSSIAEGSLDRVLQHLKARAGIHIAYPPVAFQTLLSAPTSKYLLSGLVEKLKGDPQADFGLVDVYGLLLAARFLVPKGDLEVSDRDFKLSNQRDSIKYGQNPLPIYTAVRHEIPDVDIDADGAVTVPSTSEVAKEVAKKEAWFQWFEITPYEFFCEEFSAGIPTWAMGRRFKGGVDVPPEEGFHLPETRMPFLLGVFGSAFCATLSHYYREIRPLVQSLAGFSALDGMIYGYNEDLSKVHPIDPGTVANFAYDMEDKLPQTAPKSTYKSEYIQLMDAGMSNNLPIYPLLRPGRDVEVIVAFDASADIKTDNWLAVADGYARQRGIKGWPVGVGWPKARESPTQVRDELQKAEAASAREADQKLKEAKEHQIQHRAEESSHKPNTNTKSGQAAKFTPGDEESGDLGYCTVWVGTTQERASETPPPSKAINETTSWKLMEPDAGIAIVYMPYLANPNVPGINPGTTDFLSTWNFVYTPDQIDKVVALARANYSEGREQIRGTVRAVYERKKKLRLEKEEAARRDRYRMLMRKGLTHKLGEGDQFS